MLEEPGSSLLAPSLQVFMDIEEIPLFSRLSSPSCQPLLTGEVLQSLHHLGGPLLDSLQYVQVSLVLTSPELEQYSRLNLISDE